MINLLIPVDLTDESQVCFQFAARLAQTQDVAVTLLHVLITPLPLGGEGWGLDSYGAYFQAQTEQANRKLEMSVALPVLQGVKVTTVVLTDAPAGVSQAVADYAKDFDLIVARSKHRNSVAEWVVGTELMRLVRRAETPVLCLSDGPVVPTVRRVLFATDFSPEAVEPFVRAMKLADWLDATIHGAFIQTLVNFVTEREFQADARRFMDAVAKLDIGVFHRLEGLIKYSDSSIPDGVLNCAEDHLIDLVVLVTHGRKGFARLLDGSVTEEIIRASHFPVLTLHTKD